MNMFIPNLLLPVFLMAAACAGSPTPTPANAPPSAPTHDHAAAPKAQVAPVSAALAIEASEAKPAAPDPFANTACPIMAKPASQKLYAQTVHGRLYICCKGCEEDIANDVEAAYKAAYPHIVSHTNTRCPVTGEKLGASFVEVSIQGHDFRVRDTQAAKVAAEQGAKTLTQLLADEKEGK